MKYGWCRRVIILCLLTWVHEVRRWLVGLRSQASVIPLNGCSVTNLISKLSRLAEGNGLIKRTNFGLRQRIYLLILLAVANLIKSNETIVRLEVKLCLLSVITHVERLKLLDIIYLLLLQSTECLNIFLIHWLYGHCFIMSFVFFGAYGGSGSVFAESAQQWMCSERADGVLEGIRNNHLYVTSLRELPNPLGLVLIPGYHYGTYCPRPTRSLHPPSPSPNPIAPSPLPIPHSPNPLPLNPFPPLPANRSHYAQTVPCPAPKPFSLPRLLDFYFDY